MELTQITDSILNSVKKLLGPSVIMDAFDADIIMQINTAFMVLCQLGVGPDIPFVITGADETWADFIEDEARFRAVVSYVYARVKLAFDPPTSSFVLSELKEEQKELEWRLNVMAETPIWEIDDK